MILSNTEIHRALDERRLIISPEPAPRFRAEATECPFQTTAVDLRLGNEISYFNTDEGPLGFDINLSDGAKFTRLFSQCSVSKVISKEMPYPLPTGKLVLAKTLEKVTLPLLKNGTSLAARVEGKSSYARCGLLVHFTAPTIHAGFSGTITLELINLGPLKIQLYAGMPICQLIIEEVAGTPVENESQFQNQNTPGGRV